MGVKKGVLSLKVIHKEVSKENNRLKGVAAPISEITAALQQQQNSLSDCSSCVQGSLKGANGKISTNVQQASQVWHKLFRFTCCEDVVPFKALLTNHKCKCGHRYYYSFCWNEVVPANGNWHCKDCNACCDAREWHCKKCNKCTYGRSIPCQSCSIYL